MTSENLVQYLKRIYVIEKNLYGLNLVKNNLSIRINTKPNYRKIEKEEGNPFDHLSTIGIIALILSIVAIGLFLYAVNMGRIKIWIIVIFAEFVLAPMAFSFAWMYFSDLDARSLAEENAQRVKAENAKAIQSNAILKQKYETRVKALRAELLGIDKLIKETENTRDRFYSNGLIHKKYQNLAAISSIYEYIETRTCYQLEGPDGAYNKYDYMQKLGQIETDLKIVIKELDSIRRTQEYLYDAVKESNALARNMVDSFNRTEQQLIRANQSLDNVVEYQRQSTEYNRITACNSEFMTWYTLLK